MAREYDLGLETIPMSSPDLTDDEIAAVTQVLLSGSLSFGPEIGNFERAFASYVGTAHAVGVNCGTSALHLAVIATKVREGDLVLTSPFSFVASANCILYEGGIPIFVDVDPVTGNIDPGLVVRAAQDLENGRATGWLPPTLRKNSSSITRPRLKAILPVHTFGQPCDMDPIMEIARTSNLTVIEDACEALGASYKGRQIGTIGDAAAFGFYPNKQMTTGEGGIIVTHKEDWAALFCSLRNQGRDVFDCWLNHTRLGYNYRLNEMSAALGFVQLKRINELLSKREQVSEWYHERLTGLDLLETPRVVPSTTRMSWFVYVVQVKPPIKRKEVMDRLAEAGIPSRPYFTPIHLQPFYRERFGYQRGNFPVTEYLGDVCLALPFSGVMTQDQVDYVCTHLRKILTS